MKKMRAILAVLIAAAAVMGMTATAEAAKSYNILVDELDGYYLADWIYGEFPYGYAFCSAVRGDNTQDSMYLTTLTADSYQRLDAKKRCRRL